MRRFLILIATIVAISVVGINAHGRLMDPPARSSAWREFGQSKFPVEYTDMEMFCGGINVQWKKHGGKCSICGEEWGKKEKWANNGVNYRGHIVRSYAQGATITVEAEIIANHLGYFEYRVCNRDQLGGAEATHACLNQNLLVNADTGRTQTHIGSAHGKIKTRLRLPAGLKCKQCVLQWKYHSGNNWGTDPVTGKSGMGLGIQEEFYGCADVKIGY